MFVTSHLCNWEWLLHGVALQLGYPVDAAYKPLHDQWAERLMLEDPLAVRRAPGACQGVAGGFPETARDRARGGDERRSGAGLDGQALLDADSSARTPRSTSAPSKLRAPCACPSSMPACGGCAAAITKWSSSCCGTGAKPRAPNAVTERYARACEIDVLKSPADWLWSYRRWRLKKPLYGAD